MLMNGKSNLIPLLHDCDEHPWIGDTNVCSDYVGHMTQVVTTPIYGKTSKKYAKVMEKQ